MTSRRPGAFSGSCAITHPATFSLVGGYNGGSGSGSGGAGAGGGQKYLQGRWCKLLTVANSLKRAHSSSLRRGAIQHTLFTYLK